MDDVGNDDDGGRFVNSLFVPTIKHVWSQLIRLILIFDGVGWGEILASFKKIDSLFL